MATEIKEVTCDFKEFPGPGKKAIDDYKISPEL